MGFRRVPRDAETFLEKPAQPVVRLGASTLGFLEQFVHRLLEFTGTP